MRSPRGAISSLITSSASPAIVFTAHGAAMYWPFPRRGFRTEFRFPEPSRSLQRGARVPSRLPDNSLDPPRGDGTYFPMNRVAFLGDLEATQCTTGKNRVRARPNPKAVRSGRACDRLTSDLLAATSMVSRNARLTVSEDAGGAPHNRRGAPETSDATS
jgi:hypothetical protein